MYRPSSDAIIIKVVNNNPKREGSSAHARFNLYVSGMTVADFLSANGTMGDIFWDLSRAYIAVSDYPYIELYERVRAVQ